MGKELEKHTITSTTVVFTPKSVLHCPLNFRVIRKPVLFHALYLGPYLDAKRIEIIDEAGFNWEGSVNLRTFGPPKK